MRKTIITLILILVAVYAVLSVLSLGDEYRAESLFYRAMKANEKIVINPDVAPPKLCAAVENNLRKILEGYPETTTAKSAHIALAEFYLYRKKYDKALSTLGEIIEAEGQDLRMLSKAHFYKGVVHEKQDEWDKALKEYTILRDAYTDTGIGLQMPLYIGRYYAEKGEKPEAAEAYEEAARYYEKLETENRGEMLGYAASTLLRQTYIILWKYEEAGRVVEETIDNYPSEQTYVQQLPSVELIFVKALKRPEKAVEIYKKIIEKTKNERLIKQLQKRIGQLEAN